MLRRRNPFPGVSTGPYRHGKLRHRLKRTVKGRKVDCYLPGPYGSTEFRQAYEEACEGARLAGRRARPSTVAYLIEAYLGSKGYLRLADSTRRDVRGRLDWIKTAIGDAKYSRIEPRHIAMLMEKKGGPSAANRLRKDLSQLYRFAAKMHGFKGQSPAALADRHPTKRGGFRTWEDADIDAYRATHARGTKARLALEILLATGAARQDAAALTRRNIRGGRIAYRRGKTGELVDLPLLPELATELEYLPPDQMMLLAHGEHGKGYTPESLGNWFRDRCTEAGLPQCSAHGLRKAGARRLAEARATEFEVMSFLGHRTAREASRYTAAANRVSLADSGLAKLGAKTGTKVPNLTARLGNKGR